MTKEELFFLTINGFVFFTFLIHNWLLEKKIILHLSKIESNLPIIDSLKKTNGTLERLTLLTENIGENNCPFRQGQYCTYKKLVKYDKEKGEKV